MRILFVLPRLPWPVVEGSAVQITNVMRGAAREHEVRVLALVSSAEEARLAPALAEYLGTGTQVETITRDSRRSPLHRIAYRILRDAGNRWLKTPGELLFNRSSALDRRIAELVHAGEVDCLACEYWFMMPHLLGHGVPTVLDEDDVNFQRLQRGAEMTRPGRRRKRAERLARQVELHEMAMVKAATHVIAVSEADRATLLAHALPTM